MCPLKKVCTPGLPTPQQREPQRTASGVCPRQIQSPLETSLLWWSATIVREGCDVPYHLYPQATILQPTDCCLSTSAWTLYKNTSLPHSLGDRLPCCGCCGRFCGKWGCLSRPLKATGTGGGPGDDISPVTSYCDDRVVKGCLDVDNTSWRPPL